MNALFPIIMKRLASVMSKIRMVAVIVDRFGANDRSFADGFAENSCDLTIVDIAKFIPNTGLVARVQRKVTGLPPVTDINRLNAYVARVCEVERPDVLFVARGIWIQQEIIRRVRDCGIIAAHWHPDDAFNPENSSAIFARAIPEYDLIITPKSFNVEEYRRAGARKTMYLPYAYDPRVHYPVEVSQEERRIYGSDVVFVGTKRRARVGQLEYAQRSGCDLKIWGDRWNRLAIWSPLRKDCTFKVAVGPEMSKIFCSSKIALGFLNSENRDLHTARSYEVPASGGFFLAQRSEEHNSILREGVEADYFSSDEEMVEKIRWYTDHDEVRVRLRNSGYSRIRRGRSTYADRARDVLREIGIGSYL